MKVSDCMKRNVVSIAASANIGQAAALIAARHIGTLPVVEPTGRLVGMLQLRDLLALVMPDFVRLVEDFDFVRDFGAVESRLPKPEALAQPVQEIMQPPLSVEATCGLLRAFATMRKYDLHDLPVVTPQGYLVGIASRVDIGAALLSNWKSAPPGGGP
jgi:CBS-domain-containing membrane protein